MKMRWQQLLPPGMVDALVCLECEALNPPMTARCRNCISLLSGINSEIRSVAQPALGVIHLSDDRIEPVDADLLIGRNPGRFGVRTHERPVAHGIGDRSVSRLHLELKLDGWSVTATNLKKGTGTEIETRLGGRARLPTGVPHPLSDGRHHLPRPFLAPATKSAPLALDRVHEPENKRAE